MTRGAPRVGVLGAGQLGRMLALAGHPLGIACVAFAGNDAEPACAVTRHVAGAWSDQEALARFAASIDLATFEFENVPFESARWIAERVPVLPSLEALRISADRVEEKRCFRSLGIETAPFHPVDTRGELDRAIDDLGLPAVLKTRTMGYDGKGQRVLRSAADLEPAWEVLGSQRCILERWVAFDRELSILGVRGAGGAVSIYPLFENRHQDGILRVSTSPATVSEALRAQAESAMHALLSSLSYVGVLALETFEVGGRLYANEMAPRVHNTGHLTIEGATTSQFENHLRAICGLPLGSCAPVGHSGMANLIGTLPERERVLAIEGAHLHLYGKDPRPGRKLGHVTVTADSVGERDERLARVLALL